MPGEFSEPFGIAVKGDDTYISDGQNGKILKIAGDGTVSDFASGFETPSAIAFAKNGDLIVADTGSHSIKSVNAAGEIRTLSGAGNRSGNTFGPNDS